MIDPIALDLGIVQIRWYGIVYALAFLGLYWYLLRNRTKHALSKENIETLLVYLLVGLLVGARVFHMLFSDWDRFITNPLTLFFIWQGGMSFYGALVGLVSATFLFARKHKNVNVWTLLDTGALGGSIAIVFGRLANYINQELPGRIVESSSTWCITYETIAGCRHPYVLYAAAAHLMLFTILFMFQRKVARGQLFAIFIAGYGILRILTDFLRADPTYFGLSVWQYISIIPIGIGIWLYVKFETKTEHKVNQKKM